MLTAARFPLSARPLIFLAALLLLLLALPAPHARAQESTLDRVRRTRVLRIGTDATYPPFESLNGTQFEGFDIELGSAIAAELGARAQWVNTSFDGIFPALLAEKFDMVISSVTITEERRQQLAFSDPYYTAGQIVAIRQNTAGISGIEDLKGKLAGIQINTTAALVLQKYPEIRVRQFQSIDLALQDLANGNVAAVVGDAPTIRYFINRGFTSLRTVGDLLTREQYGIAFRQRDGELRDAVNAALARLKASGRFAAMEQKWLTERRGRPATPWGLILGTLAQGLLLTVQLTLLALAIGLPLGLMIALVRQVRFAPVRWLFDGYVELLRGTPLLVQIIFIYYALPQLARINLEPYPAAVLALSLNSSAYIAEIFRGGIQSIDAGQMEAARSLGMPYGLAMRHVVLPQAFRRVLPPMTNETIALLKDSSLVSIIGMMELARAGQQLASQFVKPLEIWMLVALFYLAVTFPLTRLAGALERRWAVKR